MTVARSSPKICALATQGLSSGDGSRLKALVGDLDVVFVDVARGPFGQRLIRMPWHVMREVRRASPDLVLMEGTGVGGGLPLIVMRLLFGIPYVFSTGDAIGPYLAGRRRALVFPGWIYERVLCRLAAGVIGWTPYLTGRALSLGAPRAMTAAGWIPHYPVEEQQRDRERVRAQLRIPAETLVIGIVGTLMWNPRYSYCYGLEIVKAIRRSTRRDVAALIVGAGSGRPFLENEAGPELGKRVHLIGPVPREEVSAYLAAMDIGSLPQSVDQVGGFRYSTKLPEYVAAGLPTVTGQIPASYDLDTGWIWRLPGDAPWDPTYVKSLVAMLDGVTREEIDQKRQAMVDQPPDPHQQADGARVSRFLLDVVEREHSDESQN